MPAVGERQRDPGRDGFCSCISTTRSSCRDLCDTLVYIYNRIQDVQLLGTPGLNIPGPSGRISTVQSLEADVYICSC
jgi:hypothetical protein